VAGRREAFGGRLHSSPRLGAPAALPHVFDSGPGAPLERRAHRFDTVMEGGAASDKRDGGIPDSDRRRRHARRGPAGKRKPG